MKLAVFGMGYVGCVTAACLSRDGHSVIGVDVDENKIQLLRNGVSPVAEPGLDDLIRAQTTARRLKVTTDAVTAVRESEMALITVGTPSAEDGSVEYQAVERVIRSIGTLIQTSRQPYQVVVRSTLLPGVLEDCLTPVLTELVGDRLGKDIYLNNNPEFLRETTAIRDYDNPPFILVGADEPRQADTVLDMYGEIGAERIVTNTRIAAMVKYACNSFHALKVAFANEIGSLAKAMMADGTEVMDIVCRDHRLNISPAYLRPGFAFGGSCLPKDVRALARFARQNAIRTDLIDSLLPSNQAHLERAIRNIQNTGYRRIGLVGLSFKAGTDDLRESPQVTLAETLFGRGYDLRIYDPNVRLSSLKGTNLAYVDQHLPHLANLLVHSPAELAAHAEMLVIGTSAAGRVDWNDYFRGLIIDLRRDLVAPCNDSTTGDQIESIVNVKEHSTR